MTEPIRFSPVRCSATVDPRPDGQWRVRVEGLSPHRIAMVYIIKAPNEDSAAQQGINQFVTTQEGLDRLKPPAPPSPY